MEYAEDLKTLIIYHRNDFDGICSGEICRKAMPKAEMLGYEYGDSIPDVTSYGMIYMVDIAVKPMLEDPEIQDKICWIDHHVSSMKQWDSMSILGLRMDGVAACRLCWQWFYGDVTQSKQSYVDRKVKEPLLVRMLGEYDVWDHRDPRAKLLQLGLKAQSVSLGKLLADEEVEYGTTLPELIAAGKTIQSYVVKMAAQRVLDNGWSGQWQGLTWLILNGHGNSLSFEAGIHPVHDGCLMWSHNGTNVRVSLYGVPHRPDIDVSQIAVRMGGGGHRQACGFTLPLKDFLLLLNTIQQHPIHDMLNP